MVERDLEGQEEGRKCDQIEAKASNYINFIKSGLSISHHPPPFILFLKLTAFFSVHVLVFIIFHNTLGEQMKESLLYVKPSINPKIIDMEKITNVDKVFLPLVIRSRTIIELVYKPQPHNNSSQEEIM